MAERPAHGCCPLMMSYIEDISKSNISLGHDKSLLPVFLELCACGSLGCPQILAIILNQNEGRFPLYFYTLC